MKHDPTITLAQIGICLFGGILILILFYLVTRYIEPGPRATSSKPTISIVKTRQHDAITARLREGIQGK